MFPKIQKIAVIGDGGWGTTLAVHLAKKKYEVRLWGAFPEYIQEVRRIRFNAKFLPGIKIPESVVLVEQMSAALEQAHLLVLVVPSQYIGSVLQQLKSFDLSKKIILSVVKGIHPKTLCRISESIREELGSVKLAVLSGPTIAREVAQEIPSTAVIACKDSEVARKLQNVFTSETFRIYTNSDVVGVELGGSLKNVIAIASGVCDGLGFGTNAKAAIVSRGLSEISRLGVALGASSKTFAGLTGLGDLVTTCFSPESRNRVVGEQLGGGKKMAEIISAMHMVAEGVETARAAYRLSRKHKVPMPIVEEVYKILYQNKNPKTAVGDLMKRKVASE